MAKAKTALGLDIGTQVAKAAWVTLRRGKLRVTRTEVHRLPPATADRGAVLKFWVEKAGLSGAPCVLGFPGRQTMFHPFLLVPQDPRPLEQAAQMEVVRFNEMASESMVYGFSGFSMRPDERRLLLAVGRPSLLWNLLETAEKAGLDVVDIVPSPVAMFNALEKRPLKDKSPWVYVNIGHNTTEIAVGTPSGLMFARAFSAGGDTFTQALVKHGKIGEAQAENLKSGEVALSPGLLPDDPLRQAANTWLTEYDSCFGVYRNQFAGPEFEPKRMVLCGGGSQLGGFADYIAAKLDIKVVSSLEVTEPEREEIQPPFVVAAGLAASALKEPTMPISLLPDQKRDELIFRRQKPYWIAAGFMAFLILGVSLVGGFRDFRRKERQLHAQKDSLARRQALVRDIEQLKAQSTQVNTMDRAVHGLLRVGPCLRDLVTLVAESKADDDRVTLICDADSYFSEKTFRPSSTGRRRRSRGRAPDKRIFEEGATSRLERVIIEGYTTRPNLLTVENLISSLTASELVASADLLGDDQRVIPDEPVGPEPRPEERPFVIDVRISPL
jgi:Tfp pilus assembly PilM family ATPase